MREYWAYQYRWLTLCLSTACRRVQKYCHWSIKADHGILYKFHVILYRFLFLWLLLVQLKFTHVSLRWRFFSMRFLFYCPFLNQQVSSFNISSISLRNTKKYFSLELSEIFRREKRRVFWQLSSMQYLSKEPNLFKCICVPH